jgi:hypothetical protein
VRAAGQNASPMPRVQMAFLPGTDADDGDEVRWHSLGSESVRSLGSVTPAACARECMALAWRHTGMPALVAFTWSSGFVATCCW